MPGAKPAGDDAKNAVGLIPVAGPFITAATFEDDGMFDLSGFVRGMAVANGVGQLVGASLLVAGVSVASIEGDTTKVTIAPAVGDRSIGVVGSF